MSGDPKSPLTRDHVVWAYRLLLDRDPENEDVIGPKLAGSRDTKELRHHFVTSAEYQQKNPDFAHTNDPTLVIKELDGARLVVDLSDHVIGLNIVRGVPKFAFGAGGTKNVAGTTTSAGGVNAGHETRPSWIARVAASL